MRWTAIIGVVVVMTRCWPLPLSAMEVSLSESLSLLDSRLEQVQRKAQSSASSSLWQSAEAERLANELANLRTRYESSQLTLQQALERAGSLSTRLQALELSLQQSEQRSSQQALEIESLRLDRDRYSRQAKTRGDLLKWAPVAVIVTGAIGYGLGRAAR